MPTLRKRPQQSNNNNESTSKPVAQLSRGRAARQHTRARRPSGGSNDQGDAPQVELPANIREGADNSGVTMSVPREAAVLLKKKNPVVRLTRYVTRSSVGAGEVSSMQNTASGSQEGQGEGSGGGVSGSSAAPVEEDKGVEVGVGQSKEVDGGGRKRKPTRKKRPRADESEDESAGTLRNNVLLPNVELFPGPNEPNAQHNLKLREIRVAVCNIFGLIFNQIQDEEDCLVPGYESVQRVYEFFDKRVAGPSPLWSDEERKRFGVKYRNEIVSVLWGFGAVVWKSNGIVGSSQNAYAKRTSKFLEYCLVHLGWKTPDKKKRNEEFKEPNHPDYDPACYSALKMFYKNHHDANAVLRQHQLNLIYKFLDIASRTDNHNYIRVAWEVIGRLILIRVKDKSPLCRVLALKILAFFVVLEEASPSCQKELKYYTRFDPFVEVRRLGTRILGEKTKIKLRYFFDQAFDKRESVRVEAFRAMGVLMNAPRGSDDEEEEDANEHERASELKLVREMYDLSSDKVCKSIVWGAMHSGVKCNNIVKSELLPKWLEKSCKNDLVKFLQNIDAYQHMRAVIRILDMLLTTKEQERFVESIDLGFITTLKGNSLARNYKPITIESFVAWLGLCKASESVESIRGRVVPSADEMLAIVEGLHECVHLEHKDAKEVERNEDITPVFSLVIALEVSKRFVPWEEGNRRQLVKLLEQILLDPLLDERVIVIQAINTLHSFVSEVEFEDLMMSVFQDIFDSQNTPFNRSSAEGFANRSVRGVSSSREVNRAEDEVKDEEERRSDVSTVQVRVERDVSGVRDDEAVVVEEEEVEEMPVPLTAYELTKMRSQLCDLAMQRLNLQKAKTDMINNKQFIEAIPINNEILQIQTREAELAHKLREQEDIARRLSAGRREAINPTPPIQQDVLSSSSSSEDEEGEVVRDSGEEMEEGGDGNVEVGELHNGSVTKKHKNGIISTVEEGLSKGLFMINAFLDLCPKMGAFVRSIYDYHIPGFMAESDVNIRMCVLQLLTRIGIIEKREVRKVSCFLIKILSFKELEVELRNVAFQGLVDLVVCYEYKDFCATEQEINATEEEKANHPYANELTTYLKDLLPGENVNYWSCTPEVMERFLMEVVTRVFPPTSNLLTSNEQNILHTCYNSGLLKLLVRGRLRNPVIISKVLCLWVNHDYAGTVVLRDLEHVLKLYTTFDWWRDAKDTYNCVPEELPGEVDHNPEFNRSCMMRVLGVAVAEGVVLLCQDPRLSGGRAAPAGNTTSGAPPSTSAKQNEDVIAKFIAYFVSFLDITDQALMRTMASAILKPIQMYPTRSYNNVLARSASRIPVTCFASAESIMKQISDILSVVREHPMTSSVSVLKRELYSIVTKFKRVFGDEIAIVTMADGKKRTIDKELSWNDSEDEEEEDDDRDEAGGGEDNEQDNVENRDSNSSNEQIPVDFSDDE